MDENQHTTSDQAGPARPSIEATYRAEYQQTFTTAVQALSAAVRLVHPTYGPVDFADFLAHALAAVAANVGSTDRLIVGRPGSWEADLIAQLVEGTVGGGMEDLIWYRTEPVVIHLNVARLIHQNIWVTPGVVESEFEQECAAVIDLHEGLLAGQVSLEAMDAALEATLNVVRARWQERYRTYADAFTAAVKAEAARFKNLRVDVIVEAITDPEAELFEGPEHPDDQEAEDVDDLALHLWNAAHTSIPLPTASSPATGDSKGQV